VLPAFYFDGQSTRVREVVLSVIDHDLVITGESVSLRVPFAQVTVDERLGQAPRRLRLPDGTFCEVRDLDQLDALLLSAGHRDGWVDRMQRHLRSVLMAFVAFVLVVAAAYKWGLPVAAEIGARHLPPALAATLTTQTLRALDGGFLKESKLPAERQARLSSEFRALRLPQGGVPTFPLLFRRSPQLGSNAFTLPDGTIVILDDLVTSMKDDRQIMAVLSHELGHAHGHHGLQLLLQSSAVGAFWTFYVGDISGLLAAAPAAVVQAKYSQKLEQQADDYGAELLMKNGLSPALLADALRTLLASHPEASKEGYLSSHPSTDARMQRLRALGAAFRAK
jgi:Zn-dependent protease with chaperone function